MEDKKIVKPERPCFNCGEENWWRRVPEGHYICYRCHPCPDERLIVKDDGID